MQNPLTTLRQVMVRLAQRRHWLSPKRFSSPEELRQMLREALADPETALLLRQALTGPVLPFVAGTCQTATYDDTARTVGRLPKFSNTCILTDSVVAESSGNVGIGTGSPGTKLSVNGAVGVGADEIPIQETNFGYSSTYKVLRLGLDQAQRSLALNVDPSGITGGAFSGTGQILIGNKSILAPDNAGTNWIGVLRATGGKVYLGGSLASGEMDGSGLVVDSGKVGIGTTSPGALLEISKPGSCELRITGTTSAQDPFLTFYADGTRRAYIDVPSSGMSIWAQANMPMLLGTNNTERMRITEGGNVGIGTSSPSSLLHAVGPQPSGAGAAATQVLQVTGGKGGNTSGSGQTGGVGASANITAGDGGSGQSGSTNGTGGSITLRPGAVGTGGSGGSSGKVILASSSGSSLLEAGEVNVTDLESIATHIGARLYQVGLSSQTQSAGLYMEVNTGGGTNQVFGIIGEVTSDQTDKYGGFMKVTHKGAGDAIYIPLFTGVGAALEAASYVASGSGTYGSKGIISTIQAATPHDRNTLFNALWDRAVVPLYGMYYADGAHANAFTVHKRSGASDGDTQIRVMDNGLGRERFGVFNDGKTRLSSIAATSGTQTPDSPELVLRGAYWNGSASVDLDWKVRNDVTGSNASRLAFAEPGGNDRVAILDSGDVVVLAAGKGIVFKSPDGNTCKKLTIDNSGNPVWTTVSPCP